MINVSSMVGSGGGGVGSATSTAVDWSVPQSSRVKYTQLFQTNDPGRTGFISGPQARGILLQSGLPQATLAEIWALADYDVDGRLTLEEFILAWYLIDCFKKGEKLPTILPPELIPPSHKRPGSVVSVTGSTPVMPSTLVMASSVPTTTNLMSPPGATGILPGTGASAPSGQLILTSGPLPSQISSAMLDSSKLPRTGSPSTGLGFGSTTSTSISDWSIPQPARLKYTQLFNVNDPGRTGFISGAQARVILLQSGLPQATLAQIWALADYDVDGRLTCEEFILANYLIECVQRGEQPPAVLPPDLIPPSQRKSGVGTMPSVVMGSGDPSTNLITNLSKSISGATPGSSTFTTAFSSQPISTSATIPSQSSGASDSGRLSRTGSLSSNPGYPSSTMLTEWAIPQSSKLKYTQLFNSHDRTRTGYLTGPQARNILIQSGLSKPILAQIWALSDVDVDGRLTCEEFVLATHLIDMVKAGDPLPTVLPPELIPPSQRRRTSSTSGPTPMLSTSVSATSIDLIGPLDEPGLSSDSRKGSITTFEDKRRENFEKGQAELDRRRQMLMEQQKRQQEERERKEREEFEKREKIRLEQERRKQQELERQLQKQRELETAKEEERRKQLEQREAARREMERQRMIEWENQRKQEMMTQQQENVAQLKSKKKGLMIDFEQVCNQLNQLQESVNDTRKKVTDSKSDIDKMRAERDVKLKEINFLKTQMKTLQDRQLLIEQDKINLSAQLKDLTMNNVSGITDSAQFVLQNKKIRITQLKAQIEEAENEKKLKMQDMESKTAELRELKEKYETLISRTKSLQDSYDHKIEEASSLVKNGVTKFHEKSLDDAWADSTGDAWGSSAANDSAWPTDTNSNTADGFNAFPTDFQASFPASDAVPSTQSTTGSKYRTVFAFEGRSEDELTIQVGDIVNVIPDPNAAPGWLQGELNGKVGWFPEAYVEPIEGDSAGVVSSGAISDGYSTIPEDGFGTSQTDLFASVTTTATTTTVSPAVTAPGPTEVATGFSENSNVTASSFTDTYVDISERSFPLNVVSLYQWTAKEPNQLSINKGDVINIKQHSDGWLLGEIIDRRGWLPKSFVKPIASSSYTEVDLEPLYYLAMYPFQSQEMGDLAFEAGEVIKVIKKEGDWWTGEIEPNRLGIFPSNYVREAIEEELPIPSTPAPQLSVPTAKTLSSEQRKDSEGPSRPSSVGASPRRSVDSPKLKKGKLKKPEIVRVIAPYKATGPEQLNLEKDQLIQVRKKNSSGWWEGEIQVKGQKRQIGWFPASYVKSLSGSGTGSGGSSARSTPDPNRIENETIERVITLYPFKAQQDDELSFQANEIIKVLSKDDPTWWKGQLESSNAIGVFPSNYVQILKDPQSSRCGSSSSVEINETRTNGNDVKNKEQERQKPIQELIATEEVYVYDLKVVLDVFEKPLRRSNILSPEETSTIFLNWSSLLDYNKGFLKVLRDRRAYYLQNSDGTVEMIGDVICDYIPGMVDIYIAFCSKQLKAAKLLQKKQETDEAFRETAKKCSMSSKTNGLPLGAYLLKPMQRITKYPLLVKKILENTPDDHPDRAACEQAYLAAQSLCDQVNEACRSQENEERLDWIQTHVKCDGLDQIINFNSETKFLGHRTIRHSGCLTKVNSGKELVAFLFNDFLLLTVPINHAVRFNNLWASEKGMDTHYRMYKRPIFLNDIDVTAEPASPSTPNGIRNISPSLLTSTSSSDCNTFVLNIKSSDRTYIFKATSTNDRNNWIKCISQAKNDFLNGLNQRKNRCSSIISEPSGTGIGRLLVTVLEAAQLFTRNSTLNSYCRVSVGNKRTHQSAHRQIAETKVARSCFPLNGTDGGSQNNHHSHSTLFTAHWNYSMQFILTDPLANISLCVSCFDEDPFAPDLLIGQISLPLDELADEVKTTAARPLTKACKLKSKEGNNRRSSSPSANPVIYLKVDLMLF